jgi:hypothetical protein
MSESRPEKKLVMSKKLPWKESPYGSVDSPPGPTEEPIGTFAALASVAGVGVVLLDGADAGVDVLGVVEVVEVPEALGVVEVVEVPEALGLAAAVLPPVLPPPVAGARVKPLNLTPVRLATESS